MILEQHDAHVALYVSLRQKVRWHQGMPVCFDCGGGATPTPTGRGWKINPLWTAFDSEGTPRRLCRACHRKAYSA